MVIIIYMYKKTCTYISTLPISRNEIIWSLNGRVYPNLNFIYRFQ